tara:strand:- start:598 stop:1590 length:993 start_codon:yes stop_codon:yes gene_type:complete
MQYKEFTQAHSQDLIEQISSILETHFIGKTVIVKGKKGKVIEQVGSDGKTESDEIYKVRFEDGTVEDIPARDMEMQGDDNKKIGENEAEELVKEAAKIVTNPQLRIGLHKGRPAGYWLKSHVKKSHPKKSDKLAGLMTPKEKGTREGKLSEEKKTTPKGVAKSVAKTAWEHVPFRGDIQKKLRGTKLGKRVKKSFKDTRSLHDVAYGLPAGGAEKALAKAQGVDEEKDRSRSELIDIMNKAGAEVARVTHGSKKHTPETNKAKKDYLKARKKLGLGEATKAEKKIRTLQNRTAAAYAGQKTELEGGEKTAKFNRLAAQLDAMRRKKSGEK